FVSEKNMTVMAWLSEKYEVDSEDTKCFDFDKVRGELFCRTRKTGDLIALKYGRKKIKDLFIDEKVPRSERDILPLIAAGEEVLWAKGLRVSENFRPDDDTKIYLHICMKKA
ncbi:MAG: tRNA lysidine(34) synthetase TilS, partial [Anaerotignum sp.]|nr:tRNA lysidine(34) synthetase TilS [Anaerotignum sp.]